MYDHFHSFGRHASHVSDDGFTFLVLCVVIIAIVAIARSGRRK